jgi:hypothetical protein
MLDYLGRHPLAPHLARRTGTLQHEVERPASLASALRGGRESPSSASKGLAKYQVLFLGERPGRGRLKPSKGGPLRPRAQGVRSVAVPLPEGTRVRS